MSNKTVFLIMDQQEERHDQPWSSYHIETSKRLDFIKERLDSTGLSRDTRIEYLPRRQATEKEIQSVHTERYVQDVKSTQKMTVEQQEEFCTKYEDIFVNSSTWKRARLAAASAIDLVSAVAIAKIPGIAFIRPPGHHAMPDEGCGFCIFNNVAIAAKEVLRCGFAQKVMIVDYDVHAANGTQECIEAMGDKIRLISIHRYEHGTFWPNMPQTGIYNNYKNTMNLPLNTTGLTDSDYIALFIHIILPSIHSFKPDLILVSSGFDASFGDPEGYMNVTPAGFATMIRMMMNTGIPVAAILEGGYFLEALAADSEWVLRSLMGDRIPPIEQEAINPDVAETISRVMAKYEDSSSFYRKVQELRKILGQNVVIEEQSDYKAERTVHAPYDTRGIYTPFPEEKVHGFKSRLDNLLQSYQHIEKPPLDIPYKESDREEDRNTVDLQDGHLILGTGKEVKLFVELLLILPLDPQFVPDAFLDVNEADFSCIKFGDGIRNLKDISVFENLSLFRL